MKKNCITNGIKSELVDLVKTYGYTEIECDGTYLYNFSEMVEQLWTEITAQAFLSQWNGDLNSIDSHIVSFHNDFFQTA